MNISIFYNLSDIIYYPWSNKSNQTRTYLSTYSHNLSKLNGTIKQYYHYDGDSPISLTIIINNDKFNMTNFILQILFILLLIAILIVLIIYWRNNRTVNHHHQQQQQQQQQQQDHQSASKRQSLHNTINRKYNIDDLNMEQDTVRAEEKNILFHLFLKFSLLQIYNLNPIVNNHKNNDSPVYYSTSCPFP
jgi:cell division protein FtsL